jgi:hypothetical protein
MRNAELEPAGKIFLNSELFMEDADGSQEGSQEGTKKREKGGSRRVLQTGGEKNESAIDRIF